MGNYYASKLNAMDLYRVYETDLPRVRQYLDAEIEFVARGLKGIERLLELGAGYGRIMKSLAALATELVGVDISGDNVRFGCEYLKELPNCRFVEMDAHCIEFESEFNVVLCLQNGLSAVKGDPGNIIRRSVRALVPGGSAFFSTYSSGFWDDRLAWFMEQAGKGLLGEVDMVKTRDGKIVCKDGFTATTFLPEDLEELGKLSGCEFRIEEVDSSSLFLVLTKPV